MTSEEKVEYRGYFPNLNVDAAVVTDEATPVYNCIAWSVGVTDRWIWPGPSIQDFDRLYQSFGLVRSGNGPVAGWGTSSSQMTHGNVSGPGHGPRWESKCGKGLRIQHGLTELEGASYGRVLAFYAPGLAMMSTSDKLQIESLRASFIIQPMNAERQEALLRAAANLSPEIRQAYADKFARWKSTWFAGGLAINSDPHSRASGKDFDALIAMGPTILPLIIGSLSDPDNFFALQLYDSIQSNSRLILQFNSDDQRILEGEQGRARRVVQVYLDSQ